MTLISLNINSAVGLKESHAWIVNGLTSAGFKVTYFWEGFPFVESIQGDERERLLKLCKTKPIDCVAYGDGFVVVEKGFGKSIQEAILEIERLQMEQPLLDFSTEELGSRLHELFSHSGGSLQRLRL